MKTILIIEDDRDINDLLKEIISNNGYSVLQAFSGIEAQALFEKQECSLLLLDLMLPGISGEELIRIFRKNSNAPIIVLSAKQNAVDKINALTAGADDYVTKPFNEGELLARIGANLRRTDPVVDEKNSVYKFKDIVLDESARTVAIGGEYVNLTVREFDILNLLISNPTKVFTRANLYSNVWNEEFLGDDNTINVHISNLRTKLGKTEYIQTVWGIGFRLMN